MELDIVGLVTMAIRLLEILSGAEKNPEYAGSRLRESVKGWTTCLNATFAVKKNSSTTRATTVSNSKQPLFQ